MNKSKYTISFVRTERQPADQDGPEQDYVTEHDIDFIFYSYTEALDYIKNSSPKIWVDYNDFPTVGLEFDIWANKGKMQLSHDPDLWEDDVDLVGTLTFHNPPIND